MIELVFGTAGPVLGGEAAGGVLEQPDAIINPIKIKIVVFACFMPIRTSLNTWLSVNFFLVACEQP